MDEFFFKQLDAIINEDISALEDMLELYKQKKSALIKGDKDSLVLIDEKILEAVEQIKDLNRQRDIIFVNCNEDERNLSIIIEKARACESPLADDLEAQKVKLNELSHQLSLLEHSNVELIKHGLIMSDKLLSIITSALMPQKDNYDKHGKNIDTSNISISSIVENA